MLAYIMALRTWENTHKGVLKKKKKKHDIYTYQYNYRLWQEPLLSNLHFPYGFPSADIGYAYNQNVLVCFKYGC